MWTDVETDVDTHLFHGKRMWTPIFFKPDVGNQMWTPIFFGTNIKKTLELFAMALTYWIYTRTNIENG
jgi:hypothetical protein